VKFEVDPRVVLELGADLISDDVQALVELVKNAYDADATYAKITVSSDGSPPVSQLVSSSPGFIVVDDDGTGMSPEDIQRGWLRVGRSEKRAFKSAGKTTRRGRTPLGDKGLGRLGTQRLGSGLEIATKSRRSGPELVVGVSWNDFEQAETLDDIDVNLEERAAERVRTATGTSLVVCGLREPDHWTDTRTRATLQRKLSQMISPYEAIKDFVVSATIDGEPLELIELTRRVRETARTHYDVTFDGESLSIRGRARMSIFSGQSRADQDDYARLTAGDGGERLFLFLKEQPSVADIGLKRGPGGWFAEFHRTIQLTDKDPSAVTPGPFHAEIDSFSLGADAPWRDVFTAMQEYRDFIQDLSGIRVYRDGFGIRVDTDWLELADQWTSARSWYGLRPQTTVGYVAISSGANVQLAEKTDREGFVDTPAYRSFVLLMREVVKFAADAQGALGRAWVSYRNEVAREEAGGRNDATAESLVDDIKSAVTETARVAASIARVGQKLSQGRERAQSAAESAESAGDVDAFRAATREYAASLAEAEKLLMPLGPQATLLHDAIAKASVVRNELDILRQQLELSYETMSLGLTAEALSHEMFNVADALAARTNAIASRLRSGRIDDAAVTAYVEHVRGVVRALRKQLAHFGPSLRFVRERRETIDLLTFGKSTASYYRSRWRNAGRPIDIQIEGESFTVRMSRGKLTQAFDNLLLNSEYWLSRDLELDAIRRGIILVELNRPFVVVSDNGQGVDPQTERSLFEPFVTAKPSGVGRGLGLFVTRQLLNSEGCEISLATDRNKFDRQYKFVLDFANVVSVR